MKLSPLGTPFTRMPAGAIRHKLARCEPLRTAISAAVQPPSEWPTRCTGPAFRRQSVHDSSPAAAKSAHSPGRLSGVLHRVSAMKSESVATRFRNRGDGGQRRRSPLRKRFPRELLPKDVHPHARIRGAAVARLPIESEHPACDGLSHCFGNPERL
jgi:hypothetical protein